MSKTNCWQLKDAQKAGLELLGLELAHAQLIASGNWQAHQLTELAA